MFYCIFFLSKKYWFISNKKLFLWLFLFLIIQAVKCFLCFTCCGVCSTAKLYASSLKQKCAIVNHCLPAILSPCLICLLRHNYRLNNGVAPSEDIGWYVTFLFHFFFLSPSFFLTLVWLFIYLFIIYVNYDYYVNYFIIGLEIAFVVVCMFFFNFF